MVDLFEQLERHAAERPEETALRTISAAATESIPFRELIGRARLLSEEIRNSGVTPGSRVGLLMQNDHHFGVALLAAASAGAVVVPLDPSYDAARLSEVARHAGCRLLIYAASLAEQARAIAERVPELAVITPRGSGTSASSAPWPLARRDPHADFLLIYTGGTTGTPKGVRLSLHSVMTVIRDTLDVFPLSAGDHILSILPLFHIMAIQASLLAPLYAGAQVSYLQTRDPEGIVAAFREQGITAFVCVPLFYHQVHRRIFSEVARQPPARRMMFGALLRLSRFLRTRAGWNAGRILFRPIHARFGTRLRGFGVGAARFAPEIASDFHDLGFRFFQGYGMTETCALAAITPMSLEGGLSSGRPLKNIELRIDSPDAQGHGEILLRGDGIMKGYWGDDAATAAALEGGWLRTGDLGYLSNGNLHVVGRKKEVIVLSSGKNIFPEPLETWFQSQCPLIQEICIFGRCEEGAGTERLHAVLVPDTVKLREQGIVNVRAELSYRIDNLNRRLPPHEKLSGFDVRFEPLPRTSARKLQRFRIQEEFSRARRTDVPAEESAPGGEEPASLAFLCEIIGRIKPGRAIHPGMNLELDLSFDSLERVELLANLQEAFGIRITPEQAAGLFTVNDVAALTRDLSPVHTGRAEWHDILEAPLSEAERAMADRYLGARPLAAPLCFAATKIFCLFARLLLRYRFTIRWERGGNEPALLCANHQSYLDFPLIAGALPYGVFRRVFTLSTSRLAKTRWQAWFGRIVRAVPIDPDRNLRLALRLAREGLRRGMVLCVFPEGHRSIDGKVHPFRKGTAIVAVESGRDVIPIGIAGTGAVWGRASKRIRLRPVRLTAGSPLRALPGEDYEAFNERLFRTVQTLVN